VVPLFPIAWIMLASIAFLAWVVVYALVSARSRSSGTKVRVNSFAITGAFLALVSFATGWSAVESGYDWSAATDMSFFLLFTYPVALLTPLAGVGQAAILLWVLAWVQERDATIGMWPGYLLAWVSAGLMLAGMVRPFGLSGERARPDISDRLLTMTIRRPSGQWMPGNRALAYVMSGFIVITAALTVAFGRGLDAPLLLLVCLAFVLHLLRVNPLAAALGEGHRSPAPEPPPAAGRSRMAWVVFLGASFIAAVVAIHVVVSSFGSSGLSGEERTSALVTGGILLAVAIPLAIMAHRRAADPMLSMNVIRVTVIMFSVFMMLSAVALSLYLIPVLSPTESLVLAGLVLVGIPVMFIREGGVRGAAAG
jgi:hypothetical protein